MTCSDRGRGRADGLTLVTTQRGLAELCDDLSAQPAVAVDTESNSLYAYHDRVCLVQLSTAEADYIVDPLSGLDLVSLGEMFSDASTQKIFHAAEQDVAGLKRDFGFGFDNVFDTMWAARILGWSRVGLADVLKKAFGVSTDKRYQRFNWGARPLPQDALDYARKDTHHLLPLRDVQVEELRRIGRLEEAIEVFGQLAQTPAAGPSFGPWGFWRLKEVHDLTERERAVLWEVYHWRDRVARERNQPPFRVASGRALLALARSRPRKPDNLTEVPGLARHLLRRYGPALLAAVARGEKAPAPKPPPSSPRPSDEQLARHKALRSWRRRVAARRGVDSDVVLSNAVLWALAERNPATLEELEGIEGLGPWKRATYGPDLLRVLRRMSGTTAAR